MMKVYLMSFHRPIKRNIIFEWVGMYGFNNTYGIGVRNEIAQSYGVKTYSDLARIAPSLNIRWGI